MIESRYDKIIAKNGNQTDVYDLCKDAVLKVINGFNCTIFAYGQTGSGKTHTMFGPNWEESVSASTFAEQVKNKNKDFFADENTHGIIPRSITDIFKSVSDQKEGQKFTVYCSFLQVYNEKLYDLL